MKKIRDFNNYSIDKKGNIYSDYSGSLRMLKYSICGAGYKTIHLYRNKKRYAKMIHRLVAETYLENINEQVNHIDGNKLNNNLENLEWVTASENLAHAVRTGLRSKPPKQRKLSDEQILTILTFNIIGMDNEFANLYGVSKSSICNVRNRKSYKDII